MGPGPSPVPSCRYPSTKAVCMQSGTRELSSDQLHAQQCMCTQGQENSPCMCPGVETTHMQLGTRELPHIQLLCQGMCKLVKEFPYPQLSMLQIYHWAVQHGFKWPCIRSTHRLPTCGYLKSHYAAQMLGCMPNVQSKAHGMFLWLVCHFTV